MRFRFAPALLALLVLAGCGVGDDATQPASAPSSALLSVAPTAADGVVASFADLAGSFWRPISEDGEPIPAIEGDYWEFFDRADSIHIDGYDGCNSFGTDSDTADPALVGGVLANISVYSEAAGCPDNVESGPYPADGDSFRLIDSDTLLVESDGGVRIELVRVVDSAPTRDGDPDAFVPLDDFELLVDGYWHPIEIDGEPAPESSSAFWRLSQNGEFPAMSGSDSCNTFSDGFRDGQLTTFVDGALTDVSLRTTKVYCPDTPGTFPIEGDRFSLSGDARTLRVHNAGTLRVVLELRSEQPLGDRLTPTQELEQEAERAAEQTAAADAAEAEAQAGISALRTELAAARERWAAAGIDDYLVEFDPGCLDCQSFPLDPPGPDQRSRFAIEVTDGVGEGPWNDSTVGASVIEWFDAIEAHLDQGGLALAEFDETFGHPTLLYIATSTRIQTDGGVGPDEYQLSNIEVTPS